MAHTRQLDAHKYKQTTYIGYGESSELPVESIPFVLNPGSDFSFFFLLKFDTNIGLTEGN